MALDHILVKLSDELKLQRQTDVYDIAEWNLMIAAGLPGAKQLNIPALLAKVDDWATQVRKETERLYFRFLVNPAEFQNSQSYFCTLLMITVLEQDLGSQYSLARIHDKDFQDPYCPNPSFKDSTDLFIHGILEGPGGTCGSLPMLYAAIARRLGYPVKIARSAAHLFLRWDDPKGRFNGISARFNFEASGRGLVVRPDEHYRTWPRPWNAYERKRGDLLKSLTPYEEIAMMLATRGHCLEDNRRFEAATQSFYWAHQLTKDEAFLVHPANRGVGLKRADMLFSSGVVFDAIPERRKTACPAVCCITHSGCGATNTFPPGLSGER